MGSPAPVAVVLFSGSDDQLHVTVGEANRSLAEYQQIRRVLRWPDLQFPYTSTGKLLRRTVAEWACATLLSRQENGSQTAQGDVLLKMIAEITGEPVLKVDDRLRLSEDLYLDSLGRVQLQSALEQRMGLQLEDDGLAKVETLGDLRALLEREMGSSISRAAGTSVAQASSALATTDEVSTTVSALQLGPTKEHDVVDPEHVYPDWPWSWPVRAIRSVFLELVMRPLIWLLAAPRVMRAKRELPLAPVLVIANHVTAYDGALILYALPTRLRRRVAIAMSGEVLMDLRQGRNQQSAVRNLLAPAAYWLVTALFNVFPLPRQRGFQKSFTHAGQAMDRGYSVMIFPEGTRSPDGKLHRFRAGIGLLAQQSRVPVVPVALIGLGEMRAGKTRWFRSGHLEVRVGEAIPFEEGLEPSQWTAKLEESVRRLRSEG
jgi:long-chain acyl-CoA synthetase